MNLSLDGMDILKLLLFISEAVLLTDCVRGEICSGNVLNMEGKKSVFLFMCVIFLMKHGGKHQGSLITELTGQFPV